MKKKRKASQGPTLLYGAHPVLETLIARRRIVEKLYCVKGSRAEARIGELLRDDTVPVDYTTDTDLTTRTASPHHQGIAASVGPFPYVDVDDLFLIQDGPARPVLIPDGVQDPVNLGSIIRAAECLGASGIVIAKDRAAEITPAVEKASSGATAHVSVARVVNLVRTIERLKSAGLWIYAIEARGERAYYEADLSGPVALVFGAEEKGVRRLVREHCDEVLSIPMEGNIDSLNVSHAVAVVLAEAYRQRNRLQ